MKTVRVLILNVFLEGAEYTAQTIHWFSQKLPGRSLRLQWEDRVKDTKILYFEDWSWLRDLLTLKTHSAKKSFKTLFGLVGNALCGTSYHIRGLFQSTIYRHVHNTFRGILCYSLESVVSTFRGRFPPPNQHIPKRDPAPQFGKSTEHVPSWMSSRDV